jgi:hypothetical protein
MITLATLGIILFLTYIAVAITLFGIPSSLSDTFYLYGGKPFGYIFTACLWVVGFMILPYWISITPESYKCLPFLSVGGLVFVGAAPLFKGQDSKWHSAFALICAFCALLWCVLSKNYIPFVCSVGAVGILSWITQSIKKSKIFWLEMIAFLSIFSSLIIKTYK